MLVPKHQLIEKAIAGSVISFPTDTVPALAVKPENAPLLYKIKQRPETKPLILMGASLEYLTPYITGTTEEISQWQAIANKYFPGALTLVLPASKLVPSAMNPTSANTIGIRVPDSQIARDVLQETGVLATTSANISGQDTLVTAQAIDSVFPQIPILEDATPQKPKGSGLPSTVVKWTGADWDILRQGSVNLNLPLGKDRED